MMQGWGRLCPHPCIMQPYEILRIAQDDSSLQHFAYIHKVPGYSGSRGHRGTNQVCPSAASLPSLKVAVARRGTTLPLGELVSVHSDAHAASCFAPLEARLTEDISQSFLLGSPAYLR